MKLKIAHCDCGEWEFKGAISDAEIYGKRGKYCRDCSCPIDITAIEIEDPPAPPERSAEQLEKDLKSVSSWLGI